MTKIDAVVDPSCNRLEKYRHCLVLMLARNVRPSFKLVQRVRPSIKRRTLATALNTSSDDLLSFFDRPHYRTSWSKSPTGLFGQPSLVSPSSFHNLALATLIRAQLLTDRILRARQSPDELLRVVKNLDRLSDMLCSVIDLAELIRNAHPDPEWVNSANGAYEQLCEYMNVLNTHVGLYEVRLVHLLFSTSCDYLQISTRRLFETFCQTRQ